MSTSNSKATSHRSAETDQLDLRNHLWAALGIGLAAGLLMMYVMAVRPAGERLQAMETELAALQRKIDKLVGSAGAAADSNNLLAELNKQHKQLDEAQEALRRFRLLQDDLLAQTAAAQAAADEISCLQLNLIAEGQASQEAHEALDRLANLKETLIVQAETVPQAAQSLSEMVSLTYGLIDEESAVRDALGALGTVRSLSRDVQNASVDAGQARSTLDELIGLKNTAAAAGNVDDAARAIDNLLDLKRTVVDETDDLEIARTATEELLSLKDELVIRGNNTYTARGNARRLIEVCDTLSASSREMTTAEKNLESLLRMQSRLANQTDDLVSAIETMELLSDFRDDIEQQVRSLQGIRKSLVEIVMLQTAVGRAVGALEPLIELSNLSRLSDDQIRAAARTIRDRQQTRISRSLIPLRPLTSDVIYPTADEQPFTPDE